MSLLNGPNEPISFQPRGPDGPTYYLRVPTTEDEDRLIELVGEAAGFWPRLWALKAAIDRMAASGEYEAEFDQWKELIDAYGERVRLAAGEDTRENTQESRDAFTSAFQTPPALDEIIDHVKHADPMFERLSNTSEAYRRRYGTAATRRHLVGWAGPGLGRLRRDPGGVIEDCLKLVPAEDRVAIGERIGELLRPRPAKVGNSDSPSLPPSSQTDSSPTKIMARPKAGKPKTAKPAHSNGQISPVPPSIPVD